MAKEKDRWKARQPLQKIVDVYAASAQEIERLDRLVPEYKSRIEYLVRTAKNVDDTDVINEVNVLQVKLKIIPHKRGEHERAQENFLAQLYAPFDGQIGVLDASLREVVDGIDALAREACEELHANLSLFVPESNVDEAVRLVFPLTAAGLFVGKMRGWLMQPGGIEGARERLRNFGQLDEFWAKWDRRNDGAGKVVVL